VSRIVAAIFVIVSILLAFPFNPHGRAAASPRFQLQQDVYTLSAEALASAKRFSSSPKQRAFADLEVVLNELLRVSGTASAPTFAYQPISRQQLIDLLTIETSQSLRRRIKEMKELPFRISRECSARCLSAFLGVPTQEGMTWLILDSGAGGVSLISKDYAKVFGLDPNGKEQRLKYEAAPGVPIDSPVVVTDMIMDGNLGQPFMSQYVITFDLANGRLWLAKP
jgi:hypothetical protein